MKIATVIGGGVIGLNVALEISDLFEEVYLLEKETRFGEHASGRSSEVNHAGIYYNPGSLKAQLCVKGNKLLRQFSKDYNVPHLDVGKLVVAINSQEETNLEKLLNKALKNNVSNLKIISSREVKQMEPNVNCSSALYVPTTAILDTTTYIARLVALAQDKGVIFAKCTRVVDVKSKKKSFKVYVSTNGSEPEAIETDFLFNCAGIFGDEIAKMINVDNDYKIIPVRGEAGKFYKNKRLGLNVSMNIYPAPQSHVMENKEITYTTGVHLTPTINESGAGLGKEIIICPLLTNPEHKEDYNQEGTSLSEFHKRVRFLSELREEDLQYHQCGISAKLSGKKDWLIELDKAFPQCLHLLGIDSPGMTASRALGIYVKEIVKSNFGLK